MIKWYFISLLHNEELPVCRLLVFIYSEETSWLVWKITGTSRDPAALKPILTSTVVFTDQYNVWFLHIGGWRHLWWDGFNLVQPTMRPRFVNVWYFYYSVVLMWMCKQWRLRLKTLNRVTGNGCTKVSKIQSLKSHQHTADEFMSDLLYLFVRVLFFFSRSENRWVDWREQTAGVWRWMQESKVGQPRPATPAGEKTNWKQAEREK